MEIDEYFNVKLKTLAEKILESEEFTPDYLENLISVDIPVILTP